MNPLLHDDLFILICNRLDTMKNIIKLELLSKFHFNLIRNTIWYKNIYIKDHIEMQYILTNYRLKTIWCGVKVDVNEYITYLRNCDYLSIRACKVTDESVKYLTNLRTLYLGGCYKVTDESVKCLTKLRTLDLSYCKSITDESVRYLTKLHNLDLSGCNKITDESVKYLTSLNTLNLTNCINITDKGIKNLTNISYLNIFGCKNISQRTINLLISKGCEVYY